MNILRRLPFTSVAGLGAATIVGAIVGFDLELIHAQFFVRAQDHDTWVDDCLAALVLVVIGCLVDTARTLAARKAAEIQSHRLRVLKATMRTVHDTSSTASTSSAWRREGRCPPPPRSCWTA